MPIDFLHNDEPPKAATKKKLEVVETPPNVLDKRGETEPGSYPDTPDDAQPTPDADKSADPDGDEEHDPQRIGLDFDSGRM